MSRDAAKALLVLAGLWPSGCGDRCNVYRVHFPVGTYVGSADPYDIDTEPDLSMAAQGTFDALSEYDVEIVADQVIVHVRTTAGGEDSVAYDVVGQHGITK